MSDEDRALAALERQRVERDRMRREAPAFGTPIHVPADEDFTPIGDVFERLTAAMPGLELTDRDRQLLQVVWIHTANMEMRSRKRLDDSDSAKVADEIADLNERFIRFQTDLTGASGNNGKLGNLRKDVDEARARADKAPNALKRAIALAAGAILGALVPAVMYVKNANDSAAAARAHAAAEAATIRAELEAGKADRAFLHAQIDSMVRMARPRASSPSPSPGETP